MKMFFKYVLLMVMMIAFKNYSKAQGTEKPFKQSFEDKEVLAKYKTYGNSELSLSKDHHKFGKSSLMWNWNGKSSFQTSDFQILLKEESPLRYGDHFPASPTLIMSVYNENSQQGNLRISYGKNGEEQVWFPIPLNFTGWRTIWVPFYEINGTPPKKGEAVHYDSFKVSSSTESSSGTLFFDDIVFSQYQDDRHPYPDMIVPFIKEDLPPEKINHWMPRIKNMQRLQNINLKPVSQKEKMGLAKIERRLNSYFDLSDKSTVPLSQAFREFEKLNLETKKGNVLGPPLTFQIDQVYFDEDAKWQNNYIDIRDFGNIMKKLANFYLRAPEENKPKIEQLFLTASKYYLDQGWQAGSSGGTRHHIGYGVRNLTEAFYIMKGSLREAGILNEIGSSLKWLYNLGKILGSEEGYLANVDYFNTQAFYDLLLIFMTEDIKEQVALLNAYSNYMSITLAQDGPKGVFKKDGTVWHHNGHYPAYGMGAFKNVPPIIHTLSGTTFQISTAGHRNFKKAFLATRLYSQLYDYGFGNAGRHPLKDDNNIKRLRKAYLQMAYAGNPEHSSKIDRDVASAYLRLWGAKDEKNKKIFESIYNIETENLPGYVVFPYAATAVHRRDHWAAIIKGYSKYVWASEIYVDENRYGRYPANGSIQLFNRKGKAGSGFNQSGWNWNRYPGTTVIVLPFDILEPETPLLMFKSDETFAGAAKLGPNGVFAMKLNESKGSNADGPMQRTGFPGKLKANKSVFSFGAKLICIGTGISSVDEEHPVQTNLFQNYLLKKNDMIYVPEEGKVSKFPFQISLNDQTKNGKWLLDGYNNAYHILSNNPVEVRKQKQKSYHSKYSIRTGKMNPKGKGATVTHGNYAVAWLEHGNAPKSASYQYVIYPNLKEKQVDNFPESLVEKQNYEILQANDVAHIVEDAKSRTTGYVIFDAEGKMQDDLLKNVSVPSILMIKNEGKSLLKISALNPDLNMPDFEDKNKSGYSLPVELSFTLNGVWELDGNTEVKSIFSENGQTKITIENQNGFSKVIQLKKGQ